MEIIVSENNRELGEKAGKSAAEKIRKTIAENGQANIILATGSSQFQTLLNLLNDNAIDWSKVNMFHLDEYIGLSESHQASFRKYLRERFINQVPALMSYTLINGEGDITEELKRLSEKISQHPIDVALVGIGENGHLAFNDPPADFETAHAYIVVDLDLACRQQQLDEGWFNSLAEVPQKAISMSIKQIMLSKSIVCSVPDLRKAGAVKNTLKQKISPMFPASILQNHPDCELYLDNDSASQL
ncbi:glucosamine-6-phosphate deaminase [Emticicia sp. BO119]|uniref:glucosamine-6-phosphate deaminase n=1 Tax=Emticicia sp. BO119 TaxID=2757768 RepID=UPI0015F085F6|nr:glucosamine-6-phosphate deaminase [Emticicia sp. BO119]MBA4850189.1 glucosamine-6-phosphate deaminase [Emticicia sp. BO119]